MVGIEHRRMYQRQALATPEYRAFARTAVLLEPRFFGWCGCSDFFLGLRQHGPQRDALADQVADHHQPGGRCRRGLRASFVYYARHVEKNSSLSNWIDGFLATAAREWLAARKGDE
jgi:hypothetical protein